MTITKPLLVLGISGSLRKASYNTALLHAAADLLPQGDILTEDITPVIGAHIGPDAVGFAVVAAPK